MTERRIFDFAGNDFERTIAHGGSAPILFHRITDASKGSGFNWVDLVVVPQGADIGIHTHENDSEEMYVVIEGEGRMSVDGLEVPVRPGHVVVNRPGGTHAITNTGKQDLKLVVVDVTPRVLEAQSEEAEAQDSASRKRSAGLIHTMRCETDRRYRVELVHGLLDSNDSTLAETLAGRKALVVTTPNVMRMYGQRIEELIRRQRLDASLMVLDCSEDRKSLRQVTALCHEAIRRCLGRRSVIVGIGGGVCMDIVSVAASAIRRGIAHIRIPTTLIGQIDAGIGVKGAINLAGKKSYFGCFHAPEAVLIDPIFLRTLPQALLRFGLAEIIKMALVRDPELFDIVAEHHAALLASGFSEPKAHAEQVLRCSAKRMLEELEANPYEDRTYKRLVDFGHTFSPLLEAACDFTMHHGQAVSIDMALSVTLAEALGLLGASDRNRVVRALRDVGLPISSRLLTVDRCVEAMVEAARHRGGAPNLVVPTAIGKATFLERLDDVPRSMLDECIARLNREAMDE